MAAFIVGTPSLRSRSLSRIVGWQVYLKFENLRFTAAYKERGALNRLLLLSDEARKKGVIAASAGNHSQGLAYHGARLGVPVPIVMPKTTPLSSEEHTSELQSLMGNSSAVVFLTTQNIYLILQHHINT